MTYKLPILTTAILAAVAVATARGQSDGAGQGGGAPTAEPITGQKLVTRAARRLHDIPLSAKLLHEVNFLGQKLSGGEGSRYSQLGRGSNRVRFELKLGVGNEQVASLVHVCNGEHLYVRRVLPGQTIVTRVRVDAVEAAIDAAREKSPENASLNWIAIGGLSRLLQVLAANFDFGPPRVGRFGDRQVWIVEGRWKPGVLVQLLPEQCDDIMAGRPPRLEHLAPELPTSVAVALGADRELPLFPHFIQYRRSNAEGKTTPLVTLKFYDVERRPDLTAADFDYTVTETAEVIDDEDRFIRGLGLQPVK